MPLLDRLAHRIAGPTIGQLQNEIARLHLERKGLLARAVEAEREAEHLRGTVLRYGCHLDDIRCDLADAGIAIPEHDDPELTPREMARAVIRRRDTLQARLDALTPKPVPPLSEGRRRVILRAVDYLSDADVHAPSAPAVAEWALATDVPDCLKGLTRSSVERFVSRLAAEGYLVSDAGKPMRYRVSESGRADLAGVAA